jgi:hypothetical protein
MSNEKRPLTYAAKPVRGRTLVLCYDGKTLYELCCAYIECERRLVQ